MKLYKEIKKIAKCEEKIRLLISELVAKNKDFEEYGIDWNSAKFVTLTKQDIQHFKNDNGETEDYFVIQHTGYCEDDFYGTLYFKTDVSTQYVEVHFSC